MEKIIIVGGGGHAKVVISIIKKRVLFDILGYLDFNDKGEILGVPYIGGDDKLHELFLEGVNLVALGLGQVDLTQNRFNVVKKIKEIGLSFPPIVSKDAIVNEDVFIDEGSQIFDGVVLNPGAKIGKFSIINTKATIEHDCFVGNFCHVATGAVLSGGVEIGDFTMVGSNAVVIQYKKIISNCMIGSGTVVTKDIVDEGVYIGNPARKLR